MTTLASIKNEIDKLKAAWKQAQDGVQPQEIPAAMRNFKFKSPDRGLHHGQIQGEPQLQSSDPAHDVRHGSPPPPTGQHHSHAKITKEKTRGLPDTSRAQQSTTGKPSTPCENSDTAPPTIRSTLVLPKEGENRRQKEATEDNQLPTTPPNKDLDPDLDINTQDLTSSRTSSPSFTSPPLSTLREKIHHSPDATTVPNKTSDFDITLDEALQTTQREAPPVCNARDHNLEDRIRSKIHTAKNLLATMETQEILHVKYLEQMSSTISDVAKDILKIDTDRKNHINDVDIKDFETSIIDIGYEASNIYADVYTYIAPITEAGRKLDKSIKAVQQGRNHRRKRETETAKSTHMCITLDYDCLRQEVTQHRNHPTIKTHEITKGLERRESWKSQMHQLKKDLCNLMTMVDIYNISCTDVNIKN